MMFCNWKIYASVSVAVVMITTVIIKTDEINTMFNNHKNRQTQYIVRYIDCYNTITGKRCFEKIDRFSTKGLCEKASNILGGGDESC